MPDIIHQYEPLWGSWYVDKPLGAGSFGKVYRVRKEEFGQTHYSAVKIITVPQSEQELKQLLQEGFDGASAKSYFHSFVSDILQEIRLMSEFQGNSNIVSFQDYKVVEKQDAIGWDILIRMELLTSLPEWLQEHAMTQRDVVTMGIHICRALELCAQKNTIHRDIKPDNIFVSSFEEYKLGDFGVARQIERTMSGLSKKGTYTYMAPEVYRGDEYNATADLYSLGIVMYRLINQNRPPFNPPFPQSITLRDREEALMRRMKGEAIPPIPSIDPALNAVVLKACAFDRKKRYQDAKGMARALEATLQSKGLQSGKDKPVTARQGGNEERSGRLGSQSKSDASQPEMSVTTPLKQDDRLPLMRDAGPSPKKMKQAKRNKKNRGLIPLIVTLSVLLVGIITVGGLWLGGMIAPGGRTAAVIAAMPMPSPTPTSTPTATPILTPTFTSAPTATPTSKPTPRPTPTLTPTPTPTPTPTIALATAASSAYKFVDKAVEELAHYSLEKREDEIITLDEWRQIATLPKADQDGSITWFDAGRISSLEDFRECELLTTLILVNVGTNDFSPLGGLAHLSHLTIGDDSSITELSSISELSQLDHLGLFLDATNVHDISNLAKMTNLSSIGLSRCDAEIVRALALMPNLSSIQFFTDTIVDIGPLSSLNNLSSLCLSWCEIDDITPLSSFSNLSSLSLEGCGLKDISALSSLVNLNYLDLSDNSVTDTSPLYRLKQAGVEINLEGNPTTEVLEPAAASTPTPTPTIAPQASEIMIKGKTYSTSLAELALPKKGLTDADIEPLKSMTNLKKLNLQGNKITDISALGYLCDITELNLADNKISDISHLSKLPSLMVLNLARNQISDVGPLVKLTKLESLNMSKNQISDIAPLQELANLQSADLSGNKISDWWPVSHMKDVKGFPTQITIKGKKYKTSLTTLDLSGKQLTSADLVPLRIMANLETLNLRNNQISDISVLSTLGGLKILDLAQNQIRDLSPLRRLTNLAELYVLQNPVSDLSPVSHVRAINRYNSDWGKSRVKINNWSVYPIVYARMVPGCTGFDLSVTLDRDKDGTVSVGSSWSVYVREDGKKWVRVGEILLPEYNKEVNATFTFVAKNIMGIAVVPTNKPSRDFRWSFYVSATNLQVAP